MKNLSQCARPQGIALLLVLIMVMFATVVAITYNPTPNTDRVYSTVDDTSFQPVG